MAFKNHNECFCFEPAKEKVFHHKNEPFEPGQQVLTTAMNLLILQTNSLDHNNLAHWPDGLVICMKSSLLSKFRNAYVHHGFLPKQALHH